MTKRSARARQKPRRKPALPGDARLEEKIARILRVDHAGEFGAQRIYAGQLAVLKDKPSAAAIRRMARQEDEHLAAFEKLLVERRVRPTAFYPLWHAAGFLLGAATARLGETAAMACTVAIEETIVEHYQKQIDELGADEPRLAKLIARFRDDEDEHKHTGLDHKAEELPYYPILRALIRAGSKTAIWLSERM